MDDSAARSPDLLIRSRRTIHNFQPQPVPDEILLAGLDLARWAPNHHLTQPWLFHRPGPQTVARIIDLNTRLETEQRGAAAGEAKRSRWSSMPGWLIVTCCLAADPLRRDEDFAACCCAVQNLALFLWSRGVGLKWTTGGVTRHTGFFSLLGLAPTDHRCVGLFWYGWPADIPEQTRAPLDDVLRQLP